VHSFIPQSRHGTTTSGILTLPAKTIIKAAGYIDSGIPLYGFLHLSAIGWIPAGAVG
jgi:hypothetical protein